MARIEPTGHADAAARLAGRCARGSATASAHADRRALFDAPPLRRRDLLKAAAAGVALSGLGACGRQPPEEIVPYVTEPMPVPDGAPLRFATSLTHGGYGRGVLVESRTGRPTKVEGNPDHPGSLGATDIFAQADVMTVYDPARARAPTLRGDIRAYTDVQMQVAEWRRDWSASQGAGLAVLTQTFSSPTLGEALAALMDEFPRARWYQYDPVGRERVYAGAELAFGRPVETVLDLSRTERILALDGDFLGALPGNLAYARQFVDGRRVAFGAPWINRLYAVDSAPTLTGACADHRLSLKASLMEPLARHLAREIGLDVPVAGPPPVPADWIAAVAKDLLAHRGRAIVIPGDHLPPAVHLLVHAINARLGGEGISRGYLQPVPFRVPDGDGIESLAAAMEAGEVKNLVTIGGNPVYDAPADLGFGALLARVPASLHYSLYPDETAAVAQWHVPAAHELESWGDARAFEGTLGIQQPLLMPHFGGRPVLDLVATLRGQYAASDYELVRAAHRDRLSPDAWLYALHLGVVPDSGLPSLSPSLRNDWQRALPDPEPAVNDPDALELRLAPDPCIHDGRFANNAWLQELPKPLTQLVWSNAALIAPATAARLGLQDRQGVRLVLGDRTLDVPLYPLPGQPEGSVCLYLGYGRQHGRGYGTGLGVNAFRLRTHAYPWFAPGLRIGPAPADADAGGYLTIQQYSGMHGRHPVRRASLDAFLDNPGMFRGEFHPSAPPPSLYPTLPGSTVHQWGMAIDLTACIGCNACTIACQAENNIPSVGPDEVARGHEMHWIRVDRYFDGPPKAPRVYFQPVPCMHCEKAPCEYVCPVMATVHDAEGLNVQIYNRCIGTRDCSQNCPYKVRRFNWRDYNEDPDERAARAPQYNPEVTVRSRGVMEKCTYCLQRISNVRVRAANENRSVADGEMQTACEQVCPTRAIVFGNLLDPQARVRAAKASPLDYALLAELNTRPRTTYQAQLFNLNPALADGLAATESRPPSSGGSEDSGGTGGSEPGGGGADG